LPIYIAGYVWKYNHRTGPDSKDSEIHPVIGKDSGAEMGPYPFFLNEDENRCIG
jgi:hypothetical protein